MKQYIFIFTILLSFCLIGCASVPTDIPQDLSAAELTQKAQTAFDNGNLKAAKVYYQTILDRFSDDTSAVCGAEFELAHLEIKNKNWSEAKTRLTTLINKYKEDTNSNLPREYLILAQNDLKKIPE